MSPEHAEPENTEPNLSDPNSSLDNQWPGESDNPYESPREECAIPDKPQPAKITFFSAPQPNLLMAFVWTLALMIIQTVVGAIIGIVLLTVAAVAFGQRVGPNGQLPDWIMSVLIPIGTLTTFACAIGVSWLYFQRQTKRRIAWRFCSLTQLILVVLSVLPMATLASEFVNVAAEFLPNLNAAVFAGFARQNFVLVFIAACLLPGLGEEIFFRGFVHHGLSKRHGPLLTILVTSFLFGVMHVDPVQSCGAALLGLWLHFLMWHTKSLAAPIILHVLNNTLAFVSMKLANQIPIPGMNVDGGMGIVHTPILLLLAALLAAIPLVVAIWQSRTYWVLPDGEEWKSGPHDPQVPAPELEARATNNSVSIPIWIGIAISYALLIAAMAWASQSI